MLGAAFALVSCNKENASTVSGTQVRISASAFHEATKVTFGSLASGKRPVTWNAEGEQVQLWEFVDDGSQTDYMVQNVASDSYTVDGANASKATFGFTLAATEKSGSYDYVAIYPASSSRGANHNADHKNEVSYALSVTASDMQTPTATTPDPAWMVMTAVSAGNAAQTSSLSFALQHQTAYGKMCFKNFPALASGETLASITVTGPSGKYFTGRRWFNYKTGEITPYSATAQKNTFKINCANVSPNTTAFDIWFSVLPVELVADEVLKVSVSTSANTYEANITLSKALSFKRGEVSAFTIDWSKYVTTDKILAFDFTGAALEGWPTAVGAASENRNMTCIYPLGGVNYSFNIFDAPGAVGGKIYWDETNKYFAFGAQYRYMSIPIISGYTLKCVDCTVAKAISTSAVYITDAIGGITTADHPNVVSAAQSWNVTAGTVINYPVNSTDATKQYYVYCKSKGAAMSKLVLTYSPVER